MLSTLIYLHCMCFSFGTDPMLKILHELGDVKIGDSQYYNYNNKV